MIANYHTHTWRCKHASGTERTYVEQAIAAGLKILGQRRTNDLLRAKRKSDRE